MLGFASECNRMRGIMSDNMKIGPAGIGLCGALIGAGFGYFGAPYKYDLQQIITQDDAVFKQVFTEDVFQKAPEKLKEIVNARETIAKAKANGTFEVSRAGFCSNSDLIKAYGSVKEFIPKARGYAALAGALILGLLTLGMGFLFFDSGNNNKPCT